VDDRDRTQQKDQSRTDGRKGESAGHDFGVVDERERENEKRKPEFQCLNRSLPEIELAMPVVTTTAIAIGGVIPERIAA